MLPEEPERLSSVDDMATQREVEFTAAALAAARRPVVASAPGVCQNCGAGLASLAVYCDPDCRADHERRTLAQRRAGRLG